MPSSVQSVSDWLEALLEAEIDLGGKSVTQTNAKHARQTVQEVRRQMRAHLLDAEQQNAEGATHDPR